MYGMPAYLVNLAKRVNWESEQECFQTFCHETARFYAVPPGDDKLNEELSSVIRALPTAFHFLCLQCYIISFMCILCSYFRKLIFPERPYLEMDYRTCSIP